jgi:hypothetical protein
MMPVFPARFIGWEITHNAGRVGSRKAPIKGFSASREKLYRGRLAFHGFTR